MAIDLPQDWLELLQDEFEQPYMQNLKRYLISRKRQGKIIYPPTSQWFNAFKLTPINSIKAVILGQDPYHGVNQAHGLCFSVNKGIKIPPSLANIYKELCDDLSLPRAPQHGCLDAWAKQGVLLLNATLSVEAGAAGSHQNQGWEIFTDKVLSLVSQNAAPSSFILWGSYAIKKAQFIDAKKHLIITAPHPSPLSAYRGFFGGKYFSKTNAFLQANHREPIDWRID